MYLSRISLSNFRSYSKLNFEFKSPLILLYGDNAQGKSSLLEAIYFAATTKSLRAEKDEELISEGEEVCRVEVKIESGSGAIAESSQSIETTDLEIVMQLLDGSLTKRSKVNGVPRRVLDYIGNLYVILFAPEDINLVMGSPSLRRWHIDLTLAQLDRHYKKSLTDYGETLTRRNRLLKNIREGLSRVDELTFWSDELLKHGQIVQQKRRELFEFINKTEKKLGEFRFVLKENLLTKERLLEYQSREIESAMSLVGPHRDDFDFYLKEKLLSKYGSRGEIRTAVVDLKMSEVLFSERKTGQRPILLLDDVFSELDTSHREHVLNLTLMQQTIVASVEMDQLLQEFFQKHGLIYKIEQGIMTSF